MDFLNTDKESKPAWRTALKAARNGLTVGEAARQNKAIEERILTLPEIQEAQVIHIFWPHLSAREVDTRDIIKKLVERGKHIVLPVVLSFGAPGAEPRMEHRLFTSETNLKPNRWDIYEPANGAVFSSQALDVVIAPALGVDLAGYRVGYGKGYYDELLASCDAVGVCPIWTQCLIDRLPTDVHDIPIDIIVTEAKVLRPLHSHVT